MIQSLETHQDEHKKQHDPHHVSECGLAQAV
jgi:hypothetical protein